MTDLWTGLTPPYSTIVADPPWHYDERVMAFDKTAPMPYSTMTIEAIADLPVAGLSARGAHLYLWTTNRHLEPAYGVARAWGFEPSQVLTWCKPLDRVSPGGGMFFGTTEFVLFCRTTVSVARVVERAGALIRMAREDAGLTRKDLHGLVRGGTLTGIVERWENNGSLPNPVDWRRLCGVLPSLRGADRPYVPAPERRERTRVNTTWWEWKRGRHSAKPPAFLDVVEAASPGPYVELFARAPRLGWDAWGKGYESEVA